MKENFKSKFDDIKMSLKKLESTIIEEYKKENNDRKKGHILAKIHSIQKHTFDFFPWFSQHGQDRWLENSVFKGQRSGIFLDIGGFDGITGSNSLFFEAFRGWSGVLVEAVPNSAEKARKWRNMPVECCALGNYEGEASFVEIKTKYGQNSGLEKSFSKPILEQIKKDKDVLVDIYNISIKPVSYILNKYNLTSIDCVSLDIEGGEIEVLNSFPFSDVRPRVFCIENNNLDSSYFKTMTENAYALAGFIGNDEIWLSHEELMKGKMEVSF